MSICGVKFLMNEFYSNEIMRNIQENFHYMYSNMVGVEYILLHVQDPILYVIRKQHRHSPTEATPMADYYIIAGTIYQAPDLASVFNSRLVNDSYRIFNGLFIFIYPCFY